MLNRSRIFKAGAFAALAAAGAMALPAAASAQSYGQYGYSQSYDGGYYDQCRRDTRQRQVAGGLVGAAIGAIAGRSIADRNVRSEGGLLGGVLGAAVGAGVGGSTAACQSYDNRYGYSNSGYGYGDQGAYDRSYEYNRDYGYDRGYDRDYGYGQVQDRRYSGDGCQLSESRIRLPDGREDIRYVRTCPDAQGRYRVVD